MKRSKLTAISLYTGVGGLDFGFEAAGFETRAAVELDSAACATIRRNRPKWDPFEDDIHDVKSDVLLSRAGLEPGEADILIGGPPCQPFSKSSYWVSGDAGRLDDPRSGTLGAYLRVLRDTRPKAFLLENVYGLIYKDKDEGYRHLINGIEQINRDLGTHYTVTCKMLNAAHYGVPQIRERVFLIGCRDGIPFDFPAPTHAATTDGELPGSKREAYRTAWDAIGDLPRNPEDGLLEVGGKWGPLLPTIPEGQNYLWHTNRGGGSSLFGWRTRYWSFLLKLAKNQPSWTIQAQPGSSIGPFHWNNRKLSTQELCRIQTFPDGLDFDGTSRTDVQRQLGNAVPSLLAEVLAREIRRQLLGDQRDLGRLKLMPPVREPIPAPERIRPVPPQYRTLIGDYPDHPGEGKRSNGKPKAQRADARVPLLLTTE